MKDSYNLTSKAETKSFDNEGIMNINTSNNLSQINRKYKRNSKSKKKNKRKAQKIIESPYSSHPKSDHNRSKSSYVKGAKTLKSIFQVYRETGLTDKSKNSEKSKNSINSKSPIHVGKDTTNKNLSNFRYLNMASKNDYVQTEEKSHDFSNYLNSIPNSISLTEFYNKPIKSPKITKTVTLYNKACSKKTQKYNKNIKKSITKKIEEGRAGKFQLVQRSTSLHTDSFLKKAKKDYGDEWDKSQQPNAIHNRSVQNDVKKSPTFSHFSKRPASNTSMIYSDYNAGGRVDTSQNSLHQAIMSTIKRKASKNEESHFYPYSHKMTQLDSRFTKSLQIHSPNSKFSHRDGSKVSLL